MGEGATSGIGGIAIPAQVGEQDAAETVSYQLGGEFGSLCVR